MKHVAAGAHLPTPWLFEPAKLPDDRADYCMNCSFLPQLKHRVLVFTLERYFYTDLTAVTKLISKLLYE